MKSFLLSDNYKMAIASIKAARVRSLLTMLGIIIGVVSVITTVSLGQGVKNQVSGQIGKLGSDLITVHPGNLVKRDETGKITSVNLFTTIGSGSLAERDLEAVKKADNIEKVSPLSLVTGVPKTEDKEFNSAVIIGTSGDFASLMSQDLEIGSYFGDVEFNARRAVVGKNVAQQLFNELAPIGKPMTIRGEEFIVTGVFEEFQINPINPTLNLNNAIFIPFGTSKEISGKTTHIFQIMAKTKDPAKSQESLNSIQEKIKANHDGEEDFTVLKQDETLAIAKNVVSMVTGLVAGIAAISIVIGGIGIMNIMLVSVSERKQEIGVRKAVGATNSQIRAQFLIEAIVLSVWGALIGVLISVLTNFGLHIFTDLKPVITWQVVVISTVVAIVAGALFGLTPAIRASLKDPIDSLRNL